LLISLFGGDMSASNGARPLKVLVVEDHQDTREFLRLLMSVAGHKVVVAATVHEAIANLDGQTHVCST